jgi:glyoxylase-like metal-dependent hydrolase (beta-lactamase superfamily II)
MKLVIPTVFFIAMIHTASAQHAKQLQECWNKQVKPLEAACLAMSYTETLNELEHSFEPWQQTLYTGAGTVWYTKDCFSKSDSIATGKRQYHSKTEYGQSNLLFIDYGDENLFPVTQAMSAAYMVKTARYNPAMLIHYFHQKNIEAGPDHNPSFSTYKAVIHKTIVTLFIRKADHLLLKVTALSDDDLFGDVLTTFNYEDYKTSNGLFYPGSVVIEKINSKIRDEVKITKVEQLKDIPKLLEKPANYALLEDKAEDTQVAVEKYSDHIYFLELKHVQTRVLLVEFKDFLFVSEAPLSSANGELIIKEAKKIAPGKPIRYFSFSHYHPHPIGGVRAFVHEGAGIICTDANEEYVNYLVKAPRTLNPDALQKEPKPLNLKKLKDSLTITDDNYPLQIHLIGKKSEHTVDFLVYYFPSENMVFESDLVWIPEKGDMKPAGARQAGLYNAMKDLGLKVTTVVQSWPVGAYGMKTIIPFADLEKSVQLK